MPRAKPRSPPVPFLPSCVHFACEAADCPELAVENASLNCSSSDRYHGARCTVSCRTGYVLQIQRDDELIKSQVRQVPRSGSLFRPRAAGRGHSMSPAESPALHTGCHPANAQ